MRRPPAVARVLERVTRTAREHEMFAPGDLVLASVSGGPDSVCLLYSLWHLRRLFRIRLEVFHFDHRLRARLGEGRRVRRAVSPSGCDCPSTSGQRRTSRPRASSVEAWATVARMDAADDVRARDRRADDRRGSHARRPGRDQS